LEVQEIAAIIGSIASVLTATLALYVRLGKKADDKLKEVRRETS